MLQIYPTKNGTGVQVLGDYADLHNLYSTIHKLADRLDPDAEQSKGRADLLMSLAYDVRKAFSEQREKETITYDGRHKVEYLGFNYLWSDLIITYNVMRSEAGYLVTDALDQSCLYLLEGQLKNALLAYDAKGGALLQEFIGKWININHPHVYLISQAIALDYLQMKVGKARFGKIADLISKYFNDNSQQYREMLRSLQTSAAEQQCSILSLEFDNFQEIKW
jgi:hypothetical protein